MTACKTWLAANSSDTSCHACRVYTRQTSDNVVVPQQSAHCNGSNCDYNSGVVCPLMPLTYGGQPAQWSGPPLAPPAPTPPIENSSARSYWPFWPFGYAGYAGYAEKSRSQFATSAVGANSKSSFTSGFAYAIPVHDAVSSL